jgi:hypothetical protein
MEYSPFRGSRELIYIPKGQSRTNIYPCGVAENRYLSLRGKLRNGTYQPRGRELVYIFEAQLRTGIYYQSGAGKWYVYLRCNRDDNKASLRVNKHCTWQPCIFFILTVHFYWGRRYIKSY